MSHRIYTPEFKDEAVRIFRFQAAGAAPPTQLFYVSRLVHSHDPRHSGKFGNR